MRLVIHLREMIEEGFFDTARESRDVRIALRNRDLYYDSRLILKCLNHLTRFRRELLAVDGDGGPKRFVRNKNREAEEGPG